jgi:hypothetical protein
MPGDWSGLLGAHFRGTVRLIRRFNRPTGLTEKERVWLVIEDVHPSASVTLNAVLLGQIPPAVVSAGPHRFEITSNLRPRNELTIEIATTADDPHPGRLGLVTLEIG